MLGLRCALDRPDVSGGRRAPQRWWRIPFVALLLLGVVGASAASAQAPPIVIPEPPPVVTPSPPVVGAPIPGYPGYEPTVPEWARSWICNEGGWVPACDDWYPSGPPEPEPYLGPENPWADIIEGGDWGSYIDAADAAGGLLVGQDITLTPEVAYLVENSAPPTWDHEFAGWEMGNLAVVVQFDPEMPVDEWMELGSWDDNVVYVLRNSSNNVKLRACVPEAGCSTSGFSGVYDLSIPHLLQVQIQSRPWIPDCTMAVAIDPYSTSEWSAASSDLVCSALDSDAWLGNLHSDVGLAARVLFAHMMPPISGGDWAELTALVQGGELIPTAIIHYPDIEEVPSPYLEPFLDPDPSEAPTMAPPEVDPNPEGITTNPETDTTLAERIGGFFGGLGDLLTGLFDFLVGELWDVIGWLAVQIAQMISAFMTWLATLLNMMLGAILQAIAWLVSFLQQIINTLLAQFGLLIGVLVNLFDLLIGSLVNMLTWVLEGIQLSLDWLGQLVLSGLQVIVDQLAPWVDMLVWPETGPEVEQPTVPPEVEQWVDEIPPAWEAAWPDPSSGSACGPVIALPAPVSRSFYLPNPSDSGCPGNGEGGARLSEDDTAGDLFGWREIARAAMAFFLVGYCVIRVTRMFPWADKDNGEPELSVPMEGSI